VEPFFSQDWQNDWIHPSPEAIAKRRAHLRSCNKSQHRRFNGTFIHLVIASWRDIFNPTYLIPFVKELGYTHVDVDSTMSEILQTAEEALGARGEIAMRAYFEAVCTFDTVLQMEWHERRDPFSAVKADVRRCHRLLQTTLMRPESVTHTIYSYHDPNNALHVDHISVDAKDRGSQRFVRENPYPHRVSQGGIPFVYDRRPKEPFARWFKCWRQIVQPCDDRDPFTALDSRGILFVCHSDDAAEALREEVRTVMEAHGAEVHDDGNNLHANGERVDPRNRTSSAKFRAAKLRVRWEGNWFEFQFQDMRGFHTHEFAQDDANHKIYRWGQFVGKDDELAHPELTLAEQRYPVGVYQTIGNWRSHENRALMKTRLDQTLGWNLKR